MHSIREARTLLLLFLLFISIILFYKLNYSNYQSVSMEIPVVSSIEKFKTLPNTDSSVCIYNRICTINFMLVYVFHLAVVSKILFSKKTILQTCIRKPSTVHK